MKSWPTQLPWKPRLQGDPDLLGIGDLPSEPAQPVGDAMDVGVHGYATDLAPGKVHDEVSHLGTNARQRNLV